MSKNHSRTYAALIVIASLMSLSGSAKAGPIQNEIDYLNGAAEKIEKAIAGGDESGKERLKEILARRKYLVGKLPKARKPASEEPAKKVETVAAPAAAPSPAPTAVATNGNGNSNGNWWDKTEFNGDFRYRHELIAQDGNTTGSNDRNRQRLRLRLQETYKPENPFEVTVRLATGGLDPVSTNDTFDGGMAKETISVDRAFVKYTPVSDISIQAGRTPNNYYTPLGNELIWDADLNLQGIGIKACHKFDDAKVFANGGFDWVKENATTRDNQLIGGQVGGSYTAAGVTLTAGTSWYTYTNVAGSPFFYDTTTSFNNSKTGTKYTYDYSLHEYFAEASTKILDTRVAAFYDTVTNTAIMDNNGGWQTGFEIGEANKQGKLYFSYNYRKLEKDAVIGAFTDSDFRGGGTDGKGHKTQIKYGLTKQTSVGFTRFDNSIGASNSINYHRSQVDFEIRF